MLGFFAVLIGLFIAFSNPSKSFEQARNSERMSEISQIRTAYDQWYVSEGDSNVKLKYSESKIVPICNNDLTNGIPFPSLVVAPTIIAGKYLAYHPTDPSGDNNDYYEICYESQVGRLTLFAPIVEGDRVKMTR